MFSVLTEKQILYHSGVFYSVPSATPHVRHVFPVAYFGLAVHAFATATTKKKKKRRKQNALTSDV